MYCTKVSAGFPDQETTKAALPGKSWDSSGVSGLEPVAFTEKRAAVFGRENEMYQQTG
jgi:hypothetical protein